MQRFGLRVVGFVSALALATAAAAQQAWTVKPEWVRAHEEFLASDVMAGRGSATRDEEITATYVASEFMGYGLKPAPGMPGYIQSAEIVSPLLDGHGTLMAGGVQLAEGADFAMLTSPGTSVSGPLMKLKAADAKSAQAKGAVVLLTDVAPGVDPFSVAQQMRRSGAAVVIVQESEGSRTMLTMYGGKTRVPISLKDGAPARSSATMVTVSAGSLAKLAAVKDGETVSLTLHEVPQTKPRETFNAIGYLAGSDPNAGTILLTAHLDHLGIGRAVNGDCDLQRSERRCGGDDRSAGAGPCAGGGAEAEAERVVRLLWERGGWRVGVDLLRRASAGAVEGAGGEPGV